MGIVMNVKGSVTAHDIVGRDLNMSETCATCRFWHPLPDATKWGFCERLTAEKGRDVILFVPMASMVRTNQDFSCNQHNNRFDSN